MFIKNGAQIIQKKIDKAKKDGSNRATITGNYEIEKTILIPSDFHLVLEDCHLVLGENTFCNIFTNENCRTEKGRCKDGKDHDIIIEGRGNAILDGGIYNGLGERNSLKDGRPHISVNNTILFANVEEFEIKNLKLRNQRWWAMNFLFCSHGKIKDIDFCSNATVVDEDGNISYGFHNTPSQQNHLVKNADGIDLRIGCHDIIIENITGFCEDDVIAFTGLNGTLSEMFYVEGESTDMYNLIVRNINACSFCSIIRLLNQGGIKLYNVLIDGVYDSSKNNKYMDRGSNGMRIGDTQIWDTRQPTAEECFNITVRNLSSRAKNVMKIAGEMKDLYLENIRGFDGNINYIVNDSNLDLYKILKN